MARVEIHNVTMAENQIASLNVKLFNLEARTIDRDTAIQWLKDGHSFIPVKDGAAQPALQLVEVGDGVFIRPDSKADQADAVYAS